MDLAERQALAVRHQVGAVVEVDRILRGTFLPLCSTQRLLLPLERAERAEQLLQLITQTGTRALLEEPLRLELGFR